MASILALCWIILLPAGCLSQVCTIVTPQPKIPENSPPPVTVTEIRFAAGASMDVNSPDYLSINGTHLILNKVMDYENQTFILVDLTCRQNGAVVNKEMLIVELINLNDNEPYFLKETYNFSISESLAVNSPIGSAIQAADADGDTLYYEMSGTDMSAAAYFRISSNTNPVIVVNKPLDYDLYPRINLTLTARDTPVPGDSSHTATATIVIEIEDADDKPPFFLPCRKIGTKICINNGYTGIVTRSELLSMPLNLLPGPLYAVDGDYGRNEHVAYEIVSGNEDGVFALDRISGNITMKKAVDTTGNIILQAMAYQTNDVSKYSTTSVSIEVKERNLFPPTFEKINYYGTISSQSPVGTFVMDSSDQTRPLLVFAADGDYPDKLNPFIVYRLENNSDFTVLRDGYLLTSASIVTPGIVVIEVSATDTTTSEKSSALVTVDITAVPTTVSTTSTITTTTTTTSSGTGTTTTSTPGTGTTTTTTRGTGTTTTTTPGTGTTITTTKGTGTTTTLTPGTGTTITTTKGTGTTTTTTPGTGTTITTTKGTGTTTTLTPGTGTTITTTKGTGTTTTLKPGIGTTITTTKGTGTTTTLKPGTGTTITTTKGTGTTTTTLTPGTGPTTTTTKGTGTATTLTPGTGTTITTTKGTSTTTTLKPGTGTTITTTKGTGTTTTLKPGTGTTSTTTKGTGTTTTLVPGTDTTTTTTKGTGTTTILKPGTGTTVTTTKGTGTSTTLAPGTGTTTTTTKGTGTTTSKMPGAATTTVTATVTSGATATGASTTSGTNQTPEGIPEGSKDRGFTVTEMAALGASLGAVLALSLVALGFLIYKQYGNSIRARLGKGFDNSGDKAELIYDEDNNTGANTKSDVITFTTDEPSSSIPELAATTLMSSPAIYSDKEPSGEEEETEDSDDKKVKSILTKELKEDAGYKAVWFREDAAPEVVVIEGVEDGEADDYDDDPEEELNNQERDNDNDDDDDDDDDDDGLVPTFSGSTENTNNLTIL